MNYITQVALPLSLAFIMFAMGLGLSRADFTRVARQPRDFLLGAGLQVVVLPVVAFGVASAWSFPPQLAVGIMLLAACPGGTTSNLLTHLARGDVALSISLTAVISVAGMLTIPVVLGLALRHFMGAEAPPLPILGTIAGIFIITTVPVAIGMIVRARAPRFTAWAEPKSRPMVAAIFVAIVIAAVFSERDLLLSNLDITVVAVVLLNLVTLSVAAATAWLAGLGSRQRIAITLECGLQNTTLAIVISSSMLGDIQYGVPGALYGLWMLASGSAFAAFMARRESKAQAGDPVTA